jgi:hypothetical protein
MGPGRAHLVLPLVRNRAAKRSYRGAGNGSSLPSQRSESGPPALLDIGVLDGFEDGVTPALIGSEPERRGKLLKVEDFKPTPRELFGNLGVADRVR